MKITQKQAVDAYKAIHRLEAQDMDGKSAKLLFDARKALEKQYEFQTEQEIKFIENLHGDVDNTGLVRFKDQESQIKYVEKINELGKLEVDIDFDRKPLDISNLKISPESLAALDLIVEIVC